MTNMIADVYRAVRARLTDSTEVWGDRAYADVAPAGVDQPYVVYTVESSVGGAVPPLHELGLSVRCIGGDLASALAAAGRVDDLLNDADYGGSNALAADDFVILNVTRERFLHDTGLINGSAVISAGALYRIVIEPAVVS